MTVASHGPISPALRVITEWTEREREKEVLLTIKK